VCHLIPAKPNPAPPFPHELSKNATPPSTPTNKRTHTHAHTPPGSKIPTGEEIPPKRLKIPSLSTTQHQSQQNHQLSQPSSLCRISHSSREGKKLSLQSANQSHTSSQLSKHRKKRPSRCRTTSPRRISARRLYVFHLCPSLLPLGDIISPPSFPDREPRREESQTDPRKADRDSIDKLQKVHKIRITLTSRKVASLEKVCTELIER